MPTPVSDDLGLTAPHLVDAPAECRPCVTRPGVSYGGFTKTYLFGGAITILKNHLGRMIPYILETKQCSKSPTRYCGWLRNPPLATIGTPMKH